MHKLTVVGLGFTEDALTLGAIRAMREAGRVILRTEKSAAAEFLRREGVAFETLDALYEQAEDFAELNRLCAEAVARAAEEADTAYGVFDLRDASVAGLLGLRPDAALVAGPEGEGALFAFAGDDAMLLNASDWADFRLDAWHGALLREVDTRELAGECKLALMDCYPEESSVTALLPDGTLRKMPLCEIDRLPAAAYDHRLSFAVPAERDVTKLRRFGATQLVEIIRRLRAPGGCPWDREQTHASIRQDLLEEAYEAAEAIDRADEADMTEELGDVLLQVVFHAVIGEEHSEFNFTDITSGVCEKMVRRHPHVFGEMRADTAEDVLDLWQKVKMVEKRQATQADSMKSVARALPALTRARKVAKRAAAVRFCAPDAKGSLAHVRSEIDELEAEEIGSEKAMGELGDLLFAIADAAVQYKVDAEQALERATDKFIRRFAAMEEKILASGRAFEEMTLAEMDAVWDEVKREERAAGE